MSMFDNYDNLSSEYIPSNTLSDIEQYTTLDFDVPQKELNAKGEFVGYKWHYGETFSLKFSVKIPITVHRDAIVYDLPNDGPTTTTVGHKGQQAFNTVDMCSWVCTGDRGGLYVWAKHDDLTHPVNGDRTIELVPDMSNKGLLIEVFNFRRELLHTTSNNGAIDIFFNVDKDITELFKPGAYPCRFSEIDGTNKRVISETTFFVQ